jgi:hypothetical protein
MEKVSGKFSMTSKVLNLIMFKATAGLKADSLFKNRRFRV